MISKKQLDMLREAGVAEYRDETTFVRFFEAKPAAPAEPERRRGADNVTIEPVEPLDERAELGLPAQPERPKGWQA